MPRRRRHPLHALSHLHGGPGTYDRDAIVAAVAHALDAVTPLGLIPTVGPVLEFATDAVWPLAAEAIVAAVERAIARRNEHPPGGRHRAAEDADTTRRSTATPSRQSAHGQPASFAPRGVAAYPACNSGNTPSANPSSRSVSPGKQRTASDNIRNANPSEPPSTPRPVGADPTPSDTRSR